MTVQPPSARPGWVRVLPFALVLPALAAAERDGIDPIEAAGVALIAIVLARLSWSLIGLDRMSAERLQLLEHDELTGARSRRFLMEELERVCARARREQRPVALLLFDLDQFKAVNDIAGHPAGDALLRAVARETAAVLRAGDVLCRMGGDEFVALLPATDAAGAAQLSGRVAAAVERAGHATCPDIAVGVSVGVAATEGHLADPEALLHGADEAMYRAKRERAPSARRAAAGPELRIT